RVNGAIDVGVLKNDLELNLWKKIHVVFVAAIRLSVALLPAVASNFRDRHPVNSHTDKSILHRIEFRRLNDRFNLCHVFFLSHAFTREVHSFISHRLLDKRPTADASMQACSIAMLCQWSACHHSLRREDAFFPHSGRSAERRKHIFRICRDAMLVQIHAVSFGFGRKTKHAHRIDGEHHDHSDSKSGRSNTRAANNLSQQEFEAATIKEPGERRTVIWRDWTGSSVLSAGEEAKRQRSPDSAHTMHGYRSNRIVDAEPFKQVDSEDDENAGDPAEDHRSRRAHPIARASDRNETGQKAVRSESGVPLFVHDIAIDD